MALYDIDCISGFEVWKQFSKKSVDFKQNEWEKDGKSYKSWCGFNKGKLSLGSLIKWAKEDNLILYNKYFY